MHTEDKLSNDEQEHSIIKITVSPRLLFFLHTHGCDAQLFCIACGSSSSSLLKERLSRLTESLSSEYSYSVFSSDAAFSLELGFSAAFALLKSA